MPNKWNPYQPIDTVIFFAGPGGYAFTDIHVANFKKSLETHIQNVLVIGDGKRDLKVNDIAVAKKLLLAEQAAGKKCLFMIYTHSSFNSLNQHTLHFSDSLNFPSKLFIKQLIKDCSDNSLDFFIFSCHGAALLKKLALSNNHGDIVALSPATDFVSLSVVNDFMCHLTDIRKKGLFIHTIQDLLALYLVKLSVKIPPAMLTQDNRLIELNEKFLIGTAEQITPFVSNFFKPSLVQKSLNAIRNSAVITIDIYSCVLFINAVLNDVISIERSKHLCQSVMLQQELFFKPYISEDAEFDLDSKAVFIHDKTSQIGVLPQENLNNSFSSYKPTEITKRLYKAATHFNQALFTKGRTQNLLLILTGTTGIGKTHLAIATLNNAKEKGLPTYFVAYSTYTNLNYEERREFQEKLEKNPGLLVIDDFNTIADSKFVTFIKTINQSTKNSILITSNQSLSEIRSSLPFSDNIVVCEDNEDITQRKPWWLNIPKLHLTKGLMPKDKSCGLLLEKNPIDLTQVAADLLSNRARAGLPSIKIKIAGSPWSGSLFNMKELYFNFKEEDHIDLLVIKVTTIFECSQLLNVIESAWELNRKIVIVCNDESHYKELLKSQLNINSNKEKLKGRLDSMLLTPSILATLVSSTVPKPGMDMTLAQLQMQKLLKELVESEEHKHTPVVASMD